MCCRLCTEGSMQAARRLGISNEVDNEIDLWFESSFEVLGPAYEKPVAVGRERTCRRTGIRGDVVDPLDIGLDPGDGVAQRLAPGAHTRHDLGGQNRLVYGNEQVVLAGEEVVEGPYRHPGPVDDVLHRELDAAALGHQFHSRANEAISSFLCP